MAVAWFIAKFTYQITYPNWFNGFANRIDPIDEQQLRAANARFKRLEISDRRIYKINATNAVLNAVEALPGVKRLPTTVLDNPLSSLTANQRQALQDELVDQGYTLADIQAQFPNLGQATLKQVLKFMARHNVLPAFDVNTVSVIRSAKAEDDISYPDTIIDDLDGAV